MPLLNNRINITEVFKKLQHTYSPFDTTKFTFHEDDFSVSYNGNVDFSHKTLTHLPFQFRHVSGYFNISNNNLITLIGCPETVGEEFWCYNNNLASFYGGPRSVNGGYYCYDNPLENFSGFPERYKKIYFSQTALFKTEISWLGKRAEFVKKSCEGYLLYKPKIIV